MWDVFICYSKRDKAQVAGLYKGLRDDDFSVWLDEQEILPGERWEASIRRGIDQSRIFLVCLSTTWVTDRSYAHKELRVALEIMQELPEERVFIIPARFDECQVPESVRSLQWVNLFEEDGYLRLRKALERNLTSRTRVAPAVGISSAKDLAAALGFALIEIDPWTASEPEQQKMLDHFERGATLKLSHDALEARDFHRVVEVWQPLESNRFFNILHPAWTHIPYIRIAVFRAKVDLFVSLLRIGNEHITSSAAEIVPAVKLLRELIRMEPFLPSVSSNSDLPSDLLEVQNRDYLDLCRLVLNWRESWSTTLIAEFSGCSERSIQLLMGRVRRRQQQLQEIVSTVKT
jgi:hypothetical protein